MYLINDTLVSAPAPALPVVEKLVGEKISLQPLLTGEDNFKSLFACSHGTADKESIWRYLPYGPFADSVQMQEAYAALSINNDPLFFAVVDNETKQVAGIVSYLRILPAAYSIEIGHIWHEVSRQRTIANTESAFLLIDNAFKLGYRRMEWKCNSLNDRSCQAALRLGFSFEGIFRQHIVFKSKNRDTAWFSIIDSDWHAIRQNFIRWMEAPTTQSLTRLNRPYVEWSLPLYEMWKGALPPATL